jgi:glycosyltransferase involved in cell wall biosynthesis
MTLRRKLLLIAYHFPPFQGSTGVHRTLAFAKYLNEYGWDVTVLTAHPRAYPEINEANNASIPSHVRVVRAFALDTKRHLSVFGRYWSRLAVPDRWPTWILGGVASGLRIIRSWQPNAIMSTYPIASAHIIGSMLQRWSGLPWIADLRDPMAQDGYPSDPRVRRSYLDIERAIFTRARRVTVTSEGTAALYRERYPQYPKDSIVVIPNGFDEQAFAHLPDPSTTQERPPNRRLQFVHSGLLYPKERNPTAFFAAVAELRDEGTLDADAVEFVFRGSGHESQYQSQLQQLRLQGLVELRPAIPYAEALREMAGADACMLFQASNCNQQIPAKLYEYLYCRKPVFALTDPAGDTGQLLAELRISPITPLDDKQQIKRALPQYIQSLQQRQVAVPRVDEVMRYSRRTLTKELASLLDHFAPGAAAAG